MVRPREGKSAELRHQGNDAKGQGGPCDVSPSPCSEQSVKNMENTFLGLSAKNDVINVRGPKQLTNEVFITIQILLQVES